MPDEPEPPRKVYGFKERAFARDNPPAGATPPPPTAKELAMMAGPVVPRPPPSSAAKPDDPNDVFKVLQQNRKVADHHGLNAVEIQEIKSRRKRDFWLVLVGGNLVIIGGVWFSGLNIITVIFGLAGLIIFSLGFSWVMWQVMDRY